VADQTDVKSYYVVQGSLPIQTGLGKVRIKTLRYLAGATAGQINIYDGTGSSTPSKLIFTVDTPALATWTDVVPIPGEGLRVQNDVYISATNITSLTFFYG
jgi:hypothetical protein